MLWLCISIHTTASVVTKELRMDGVSEAISIHTTASVVTFYGSAAEHHVYYFNPHHCISGDLFRCVFADNNVISIHTTASVVTANLHNFSNTIYHKLTKNCLYFYFNTLFLIKQLNFISDFFIFRCEPPGIFTIT